MSSINGKVAFKICFTLQNKKYDDISLSLDCVHKLLPVGISKDMGKCIAKRNDGTMCTNVIDRSGSVCIDL